MSVAAGCAVLYSQSGSVVCCVVVDKVRNVDLVDVILQVWDRLHLLAPYCQGRQAYMKQSTAVRADTHK